MKKETLPQDKNKAVTAPKGAAPVKRAVKKAKPPTPARHSAEHTRRRELGRLLLRAVRQLSAGDVALLLSGPDVDVNVQDESGMTPLHHAAARGARPCIRLLVGSGRCDYLIPDKQGRYAFELAIEWARDYAVGRLLAKKQAQQAAARGVAAYEPRPDTA